MTNREEKRQIKNQYQYFLFQKYDQRRRTSTNTLRTPKCLKTNRKEAHESPIRMTKFTKGVLHNKLRNFPLYFSLLI